MSTQKLPMVPEVVRLMPRISATATTMTHSRRPEVVRGQTRHLGEIAHGGFRRIELPVGIGGKAGRGVPRQVGPNVGESLRVPRKEGLQTLNAVG